SCPYHAGPRGAVVRSPRSARISPGHTGGHRRALRAGHRPERTTGALAGTTRGAWVDAGPARHTGQLMNRLTRERYAHLYGPTTGDRIRLADTDLLVEITEDRSGGPGLAGDEAVFGGGKVLRESMGQGRASRAEGAPDTVITGAVVIDHWGIIK